MSRILLVDDEPGIRDLLSEHLEMEGFVVDTAEDGEAALECMRHRRPDLLLLDVMLPGMDGYEVCTEMQADPVLSNIPVIMLTARSMTQDLASGYEMGADDYVTKPFDIDELLIRIRAQLHHLYREQVSDLTGLPGSEAVEDELARRMEEAGRWALLYADIRNLRVFNEAYSFTDGDILIRLASDALKSAIAQCDGSDAFLGHVSGANFVAVVSRDAAPCVCGAATSLFEEHSQQLYSPTDRERNYLIALDRDGQAKKWTLPSLTFDLVDHLEEGVLR